MDQAAISGILRNGAGGISGRVVQGVSRVLGRRNCIPGASSHRLAHGKSYVVKLILNCGYIRNVPSLHSAFITRLLSNMRRATRQGKCCIVLVGNCSRGASQITRVTSQ